MRLLKVNDVKQVWTFLDPPPLHHTPLPYALRLMYLRLKIAKPLSPV